MLITKKYVFDEIMREREMDSHIFGCTPVNRWVGPYLAEVAAGRMTVGDAFHKGMVDMLADEVRTHRRMHAERGDFLERPWNIPGEEGYRDER